ncbi:Patatin [Frankia sp. R43]|uniref:patatin-like phospholipase family protein n=1 Tax=Frankia sp. R43 TaxID=269536 RepID=UPI0006CA3043|nr:patatin-like phospholipase family protein [Frankia sp. R43]KPM54216.1 Patatin [Frankia sp. R43]
MPSASRSSSPSQAALRADLVLEGGGVKGLATAGAVMHLLEAGYTFERAAGTSVGAVGAALVAAGADSAGLRSAIDRLDLARVPDRMPPWLPGISESLGLATRSGAYRGDYLHGWMYQELDRLGVTTFGQLRRRDSGADPNLPAEHRYRLVVMATDVTHGRLLRLPWDYPRLGLDPDTQLVADAVRMSASIPFYFEPCTLHNPLEGTTSTIVDGGVLSNFPIDIFDRTDGQPARWPTIGVSLFPDLPGGLGDLSPLLRLLPTPAPLDLLKAVVATALVGHDQTHMDRFGVRYRTMEIDTSGVGITDFGLSAAGRQMLLHRGQAAAAAFLLDPALRGQEAAAAADAARSAAATASLTAKESTAAKAAAAAKAPRSATSAHPTTSAAGAKPAAQTRRTDGKRASAGPGTTGTRSTRSTSGTKKSPE